MAKPPTTWKNFERYVCRLFGGERRGADYADRDGGKNDCVGVPGFSIECKYGNITYGTLLQAVEQARTSAAVEEIPIGVVKKKGQADRDALVVMNIVDFVEWFG